MKSNELIGYLLIGTGAFLFILVVCAETLVAKFAKRSEPPIGG